MTDLVSETATGSATVVAPVGSNLPRRGRVRNLVLWFSLGWLGLIVLVALIVQWLPLPSYEVPVGTVNQGLQWSGEFLGTDLLGRSNLSRLAYSARVSVGVSFSATAISMTVGGVLGLLAAYFGGIIRQFVDIITNTMLAVPGLLLLLSLVLALNPSVTSLVIALSVVFLPPFIRLTRANARSQMSREYVIAARSMGATSTRIMFREVLPNVILPLLSYAALVLPTMMITEGSLSYLGYGVPPPTPSWGEMIALAQGTLATAPWPVLVPCFALVLSVFALNTIADYLRVKFDVRDAQL